MKPLYWACWMLCGLTVLWVAPASAQSEEAEAMLESVHNYVKISDHLATSGQVAYDQIEAIKEAGYDVVVNLAPASDDVNSLEGYLVVEQGMSYVQIPVSWQEPSLRDLELFFDVMEANRDRKVYVHCFANMRASAFVYLYRTLRDGVSEEEARADMEKVWTPEALEQWEGLIKTARDGHSAGS